MHVIRALTPPPSPARKRSAERKPVVVGVVQHSWTADPVALQAKLADAIGAAAAEGARLVVLPELTLSRYPADVLPDGDGGEAAEDLGTGPTLAFARAAAALHGVAVQASLFERSGGEDGLGLNTSVLVGPTGALVARTRKLHIPVTAGYYEDRYFRPGPADEAPYPVHEVPGSGLRLGMPTCWDQWFPEVARAYGLGGADVVAYPTAIGSEPDHPEFDTEPLWRQVIVGNGIANGTFMVAANRTGQEFRPDGAPGNRFYGSSFVSDPYGRILAQAPRDEEAVLVAALDLDQRRDWLELFPFFRTRRPETYGSLAEPVA
ncbi:nitrilase-related carbon-nitrogen hydrolase [Naasia sp. SYSU D00057]|uniref:nitrilase-related carbon-nitrogen hydrolase n=1 Tax=Naasia sp. SYSU D00057 TaxID=2817380 RepID=UPI001B30A921|nr:nitrilase-related carbon-nitrogen hydrolase [Naasia sp. SYSU D00057]